MADKNAAVESAPRVAHAEEIPADHLNEVGVLKRREIEARILLPILEAFESEFGEQRVRDIAREVIVRLARAQGAELMQEAGCCTLGTFAIALDNWKKDNAYETQVLEQSDDRFHFNVTRCRYAEMYHQLGAPWLGRLLSCNRDYALIEGFNPDVKLTRTQTIMEGASYCDFRFERRSSGEHKG